MKTSISFVLVAPASALAPKPPRPFCRGVTAEYGHSMPMTHREKSRTSSRQPSYWLAVALCLFLHLVPASANAVALQDIVNVIADVWGEPALKDAVPLIDCVVNKGPSNCFNLQNTAQAQGQKTIKQYLPDDPKIKAVVDIIKAAYAEDYLKVLEIGGVKLLPPLGCGLVFQVPQPVKGVVCNKQVFDQVANLSGPVFKKLIATIKNPSPGNLWSLATVMDTKLACSVVKSAAGDVPGLEEVCGPLGEVIEFAKDVGEEAANAGKEAGEFLWDTGSDIISGAGDALEGACEGIGLCDDDGKKLMSGSQYYTYRLFPLVHDRVLARLTSSQQHLGHDTASLQACLKYYNYDLYANNPMFKQLAPKVKQGCEDLGARLHKEADVLANAFAAAPASYVEISVKPLVAAWIMAGPGSANNLQSVIKQCVGDMRMKLPIPEPTKPGATAWDQVCKQVGALYNTAYAEEKKKITAAIKQLEPQGCKQKLSLTEFKVPCASYEGFAACQAAYTPQLPCTLVKSQADVALADTMLKQLGTKRCKIQDEARTLPCPNQYGTIGSCKVVDKNILCARPWKVDQCTALLGQLAGEKAQSSSVKCKGDEAGLAAFAKLEGQASAIMNQLNGGGGVVGTKAGFGDAKAKSSAGTGSCKGSWDPLAITCDQGEIAAHPEITLPSCASDPNQDGADAPCYAGFSSAQPYEKATADFSVPTGAAVVPGAIPPAEPATGGRSRMSPETVRGDVALDTAARGQPGRAVELTRGVAARAVPQVDLMLSALDIAGRRLAPGGSLMLSAEDLGPGGCEASVQIQVQNSGTTASGPFEAVWQAGGQRAASSIFSGIPPGSRETQRAVLALKPGTNVLELAIDASGRVDESNEGNNRYRFAVAVTGDCGSSSGLRRIQPGTMPTRPALAPPASGRAPAPVDTPTSPTRTVPPAVMGPSAAPETTRGTTAPPPSRTPSR